MTVGGHFKDCYVHQLLLEHGADINVQDQFGDTPLHWASFNRELKVVQLLLERVVDVEVKNDEGKAALQNAADKGYDKVVELLPYTYPVFRFSQFQVLLLRNTRDRCEIAPLLVFELGPGTSGPNRY